MKKYSTAEINRMAAEEFTAYRSKGLAHGICKPLTEEGSQEIETANKQGLLPSEIQTLTGYSRQAIKRVLAKAVVSGKKRVRQDKMDRIREASARGLTIAEIVRALGYSRSLVYNVLSGKATGYEVDTVDGGWVPTQRPTSEAVNPETLDQVVIRREQAQALKSVVDTLSVEDQSVIQAHCDGLSERQIIVECRTSRKHIAKLFKGLKNRVKESSE